MPLAHVNGFAGLRNTALMPRSSAATFFCSCFHCLFFMNYETFETNETNETRETRETNETNETRETNLMLMTTR